MSSLCKYYDISRNGYYKRNKQEQKAALSTELIVELVQRERHSQPRIGGRKLYHMHRESIRKLSPRCGRDRFFAVLRSHGLLVERKRSYTRTTNSYHRFRVHRNLVKDIRVERPNQVWVSDITYIRTGDKFAYLSLITDKYSRKIVGWHLSKDLGIEGCLEALKKALSTCRNPSGIIHHSDRGIQYCSHPYTQLLTRKGLRISMTEENHCYENGLAERVNGILKDEYMLESCFKDINRARQTCSHAIRLYNTRRPHWSLNLKTPEEVHNAA